MNGIHGQFWLSFCTLFVISPFWSMREKHTRQRYAVCACRKSLHLKMKITRCSAVCWLVLGVSHFKGIVYSALAVSPSTKPLALAFTATVNSMGLTSVIWEFPRWISQCTAYIYLTWGLMIVWGVCRSCSTIISATEAKAHKNTHENT